MKKSKTWLMGMGLMLPLAGCPGDDGSTEDTAANDSTTTSGSATGSTGGGSATDPTGMGPTGDTADSSDSADTTSDPPMECLGIGGPAAEGESCAANSDCMSGVCTLFTDVPVNDDAVCDPTPGGCSMRITGTVFDFTTGEPVADADLVVAAALMAATNPTGATPIVTATSGADGRIDTTTDSPVMEAIGIVGLVSAASYYLTATGLASPADGNSYEVGTGIHDIWVVPEDDLSMWSDALSMDAGIPAENLPLGDAGGVVGFVRDAAGLPIAGATVASTNDGSGAFIRYLSDDGTFNETETSDLGVFVILEPALAEEFEVSAGGMVVGGGTAGSTDGAIFTLIVNAG